MNNKQYFKPAFTYKVIYVFRINDKNHKNVLKIGDATVHTSNSLEQLMPNCEELNNAARDRINEYTTTAGIKYDLLYTSLAVKNDGKPFRDYDVHAVLFRSGIKHKYFDTNKKQNEWFEIDLETAKNAIEAVKRNESSLPGYKISFTRSPIIFRPEQEDAIKKTKARFKQSNIMLWNAKMRFGKTLTALQIAKELNFDKTIIITHRPVVKDGWFEDFGKIFYDRKDFSFGSKDKGKTIQELIKGKNKFVYFASMQDLRGASIVGGNFNKDHEIFETEWDFVVIDEAHEGTQTKLGQTVLEKVIKEKSKHKTHVLDLSGTPFNLFDSFKEEEIYTWDYIMEQKSKMQWRMEHYGDSNPYEELPRINIYTYDLDKSIPNYTDEDIAFNFKEFFRTWTGEIEIDHKEMPKETSKGEFVHKSDVNKLLDLLIDKDKDSNYPYSTDEYRTIFKHSLWMLPGVKEAKALSKMLQNHKVFSGFKIINVAGDGDEETNYSNALEAVKKGIKENEYTITLSCGRLTAGVTVPEWTAVFMLSGTYSTSASNYLQTIFRVQSPGKMDGKIKEECYVFDFAPDRMLKMVAQAGQLSTKPGSVESRHIMGEFLNFCPVISISGSTMQPYNTDSMLQQLKRASAQRVIENGFDHKNIYNDNLLKLDGIDLEDFEELKKIIGQSKQSKNVENITINDQGFTQEQYEEIQKIQKKPKKELTQEEKEKLAELRKKRDQAQTAMSILRGISIRIPLLIYGADIDYDKDIDCDLLPRIVDDCSWEEFMPKGVTKEIYSKFTKYYDKDIFILAGRQIRNTVKYADTLEPKERVIRIANLFKTFKNPDKETVLTPWKTVNMHMGDCLGGYNFNNEDDEPRFINKGYVTSEILNNTNARILEINSKTGLYPLYLTYSIYMQRFINYNKKDINDIKRKEFWDKTLAENIFVLCKTKMAEYITRRTLAGYSNAKVNVFVSETIIEDLQDNKYGILDKIQQSNNIDKKGNKMEFDAVVGNPPYQLSLGNKAGNSSKSKAVYNLFVDGAKYLQPKYISMIMPSRWMTKSTEGISDSWVDDMISCNKFVLMHDYLSATECFSNVEIKGGVCYFLMDKNYTGKCAYYLHDKVNEAAKYKFDYLDPNKMGIVIRDSVAMDIIEKIANKSKDYYIKDNCNFASLVGTKDFFTNKEVLTSSWNGFENKESKTYSIKYYYSKSSVPAVGYINEKVIPKNAQAIHLHKVYIAAAGGSGNDRNILGKPFYGEPGSVCSQTYLVIGYKQKLTKEECLNIIKYIKTKFFRYMVSIKKKTQNGAKMVYQLVPMQNFKLNSDIKWNSTIDDIDKQMYKKYGLTQTEIDYIEERVVPMK